MRREQLGAYRIKPGLIKDGLLGRTQAGKERRFARQVASAVTTRVNDIVISGSYPMKTRREGARVREYLQTIRSQYGNKQVPIAEVKTQIDSKVLQESTLFERNPDPLDAQRERTRLSLTTYRDGTFSLTAGSEGHMQPIAQILHTNTDTVFSILRKTGIDSKDLKFPFPPIQRRRARE